ncbi:MAG: efflux RND transporter periplasmic adaptor subunit [Candidatus Latescibacteria bacterium]|nr:efflux RND transporter periplasmic adaptor subunit [Candidatus Latescibacterota bacterium]
MSRFCEVIMRWGFKVMVLCIVCQVGVVQAQQPVEVAQSKVRDVALSLKLVGTVDPLLSATVSAEMAGRVNKMLVDEGDRVKEGQVLARLDDDVIRVRLVQVQARLQQAEKEYRRMSQLMEQNLASLERLQEVETALVLRKADVDLTKISLEHTAIRSPFSGVVAGVYIEKGEWINTGGRVADVIQTDQVFVLTSVPEKHVRHLKPGIPAVITCDAYPDVQFDGAIHVVFPRGDEKSHAFPIKIIVSNFDDKLKAGMFARVNLQVDQGDRLMLVPKDAVVNIAGEKFVYTLEDSLVQRVKVQVGRSEDDYVVVDGDLSLGATVVVTGNETLRPNAKVRVVGRY